MKTDIPTWGGGGREAIHFTIAVTDDVDEGDKDGYIYTIYSTAQLI
jgi:hypothetical protein